MKLTGSLEDLFPRSWFTEPNDSSIWLRLYTCLSASHEATGAAIEAWDALATPLFAPMSSAERMMFGFAVVKDWKLPVATFDLYSQPSGQVVLTAQLNDKLLPEAGYIMVATPYRTDGVDGDEASVKRRLNQAVALVRTHLGLNFMRECVFEGQVRGEGSVTYPSAPKKMPKPVEGPFLATQSGLDIAEISERLAKLSEPKRSRTLLALELIDRAMGKDEGFFEYWSALEVLCDGKGGRIKTRFARAYGLKDQNDAAVRGGLGVLSRWRGEYVHQGKSPVLTADVERYLQLLFLDLLRFELELPSRGHIAAIQRAAGYNLSPLGLPDNRTDAHRGNGSEH